MSKDMAFWLASHGGRYYRSNRKTGKKLTIASTPHISVGGCIQSGILRKILIENEHFFDAGLAARFLFSMPLDVPQYWTDEVVSKKTKLLYGNVVKTILSLRSGKECLNPEKPHVVELSKSAKRRFEKFYNTNADERAAMESGTEKAIWPKLTGYAARIALVFHVVKWAENEAAKWDSNVEGETMESAIQLVQWFKQESLRIVAAVRGENVQIDLEARTILDTIRRKGGAVTIRELTQGPRVFRGPKGASRAEKKLREMVSAGKLTCSLEQGKHGPGKDVFREVS